MQIIETPDMWVLSISRKLTLSQIKAAAAECAPLIEHEITRHNLQKSGSWLFIAHHLPKNSKTLFDWQICCPVMKPDSYDGALHLLHLEPIIVATRNHYGSLRTLFTQGYAPLIREIEMSRHDFSGESREIYHDWNGSVSTYHHIEIQFGLSR